MIQNKAFISIEETIAKVIAPSVQTIARDMHVKLSKLLKQGDYATAAMEARGFDLTGVAEPHRPRLRELGLNALLFGQQQLVPVQVTALVRGSQKVPYELDMGLSQLILMVERDLAEQLRTEFSRMVATYDLEDEKTPLAKGEFTIAAPDLVADVAQVGVQVRANLITSRLVSYGFLTQAREIKVTTYQVSEILDSRICPVCRHMHGQTFSVEQEIGRVQNALIANDPQELKSIAPWPSQTKTGLSTLKTMTAEDMQAAGYGSPPYHPGCRGILVVEGSVTKFVSVEPAQTATVPPKTASWKDKIEGIEKLDEKYADRLEALVSTVSEEELVDAFTGGLPTDMYRFRATKIGLLFEAYGDHVSTRRKFDLKNGTVSHIRLMLKETASGKAKELLAKQVALYQRLGFDKVETYANINVGGYAWGRYGFVPEEWVGEKGWVEDAIKALELKGEITPQESLAYAKLLELPDKDAYWALIDSKIGKPLFLDSNYDAVLDLSDPAAMERFNAYVGR